VRAAVGLDCLDGLVERRHGFRVFLDGLLALQRGLALDLALSRLDGFDLGECLGFDLIDLPLALGADAFDLAQVLCLDAVQLRANALQLRITVLGGHGHLLAQLVLAAIDATRGIGHGQAQLVDRCVLLLNGAIGAGAVIEHLLAHAIDNAKCMGARINMHRDAGQLRQFLGVNLQRHRFEQHLDTVGFASAQEVHRVYRQQVSQRLDHVGGALNLFAFLQHFDWTAFRRDALADLCSVVEHQHHFALFCALAQQCGVMAAGDHGLDRFQNAGLAGAVRATDLVEAFRGELQFIDSQDGVDLDLCDTHGCFPAYWLVFALLKMSFISL